VNEEVWAEDAVDAAGGLDLLLTDAALGVWHRLRPDSSVLRLAGELARGRARRGQRAGGLQRGDDVTGPVADKRAQPGAGQRPGVVLRDWPVLVRIRAAMTSSRSSPGLWAVQVTVTSGAGICGSRGSRRMRVAGSPGAVRRSSQPISCGGSGRRSSTLAHTAEPVIPVLKMKRRV